MKSMTSSIGTVLLSLSMALPVMMHAMGTEMPEPEVPAHLLGSDQ